MSNIIFNNGVKFPSLIIPTGSQPLDSRTIVQNLPLYSCEFTEGAVYLGMPVSCLADNNFYTLKSLSTDKFIVVIYKGNWELLSEVEKLAEYQSLSPANKKAITDTKVENVSKLEWQQVGKETVLPDGTLSGSLDGVKLYTGIGEDGTTPTYTGVPYTISYSDGKVTGLTLGIDGLTQKKYVDDKIDDLAYNVNYTISNLDVNDSAKNGQYVSYVSQADGKITVGRANLPTLSDLGGITGGAVDTKISDALDGLDASYTAPDGQYISSIIQTNGKISASYGTLPTTTDGSISYDLGISYGWDNSAYTPTNTSIPMTITYSNGAITKIEVKGLSSVASKDYVDGKLAKEIHALDTDDVAQTGYYVSYVSQADGKISVGREKLPAVEFPEGTYKGNLGMVYTGVGINGTPTYTDIPVTISYKDAKVTGVGLSSLDSFVKKQYVDEKVSYEISSHDLVNKKYVDDKYDALIGDGKLNDTIDTIKEISYWLDNNPDDAVELTLSLAELTEKVNSNEKTVATDLNEIHTQLDNRYTKSEIDNTLTSYAKSANVYTKTEINNTLASYASVSYVSTRLSWGVI